MKDTIKQIGERIALVRNAHKLTQDEVSERLSISQKHLSHVECGTSSLSLKKLLEFCKMFNCSTDYILFGKEDVEILKTLPEEIVEVLCIGDEEDKERLNNYMQFYVELLRKEKTGKDK